jgi:hypothetical protein
VAVGCCDEDDAVGLEELEESVADINISVNHHTESR